MIAFVNYHNQQRYFLTIPSPGIMEDRICIKIGKRTKTEWVETSGGNMFNLYRNGQSDVASVPGKISAMF